MIPADQETVIQAAVNHVKRGSRQVFELLVGQVQERLIVYMK